MRTTSRPARRKWTGLFFQLIHIIVPTTKEEQVGWGVGRGGRAFISCAHGLGFGSSEQQNTEHIKEGFFFKMEQTKAKLKKSLEMLYFSIWSVNPNERAAWDDFPYLSVLSPGHLCLNQESTSQRAKTAGYQGPTTMPVISTEQSWITFLDYF